MAHTLKLDLNDLEHDEEEQSFCYAMQMVMSCVLPMALQTTFELGIFDIIAKAGVGAKLSANDIAHQLPTKNPEAPKMLDRMLGLLVAHSLLHCSSEGNHRLYSLAPPSRFFARDADSMSLGTFMTVLQDKVFMEGWYKLKDAILEGGIAFNRAHRMHLYEYLRLDSELNQRFNTAMSQRTCIVLKKLLETYKGFEKLNTLVDVGGGIGITLGLITSKYPHIKGINYDLPHVIQHALSYPGVEHVDGDMFESVPKGDAIFMSVLHEWGDEECLKLLKNCCDATPEDGKVITLEAGISDIPKTTVAARSTCEMDVFMMAQDSGGKERTQHDFMELAKAAGFRGVRYECFVRNLWVIEFFK